MGEVPAGSTPAVPRLQAGRANSSWMCGSTRQAACTGCAGNPCTASPSAKGVTPLQSVDMTLQIHARGLGPARSFLYSSCHVRSVGYTLHSCSKQHRVQSCALGPVTLSYLCKLVVPAMRRCLIAHAQHQHVHACRAAVHRLVPLLVEVTMEGEVAQLGVGTQQGACLCIKCSLHAADSWQLH